MVGLSTSRLLLRPLSREDAADVSRLAGEWRVARMMADMPAGLSVDGAVAWIDDATSHGRVFAIVTEGRFVGAVSLIDVEPGIAELGFWLGSAYWGRGIALEAARGVLEWCGRQDCYHTIVSGHYIDNPASGRVLGRLGFAPTGHSEVWSEARQRHVAAVRFVRSVAPDVEGDCEPAASRDPLQALAERRA
ncbi:MAG: GNAT family N-acetyltransferase [Hyphomicrobiaceae bacterium]